MKIPVSAVRQGHAEPAPDEDKSRRHKTVPQYRQQDQQQRLLGNRSGHGITH